MVSALSPMASALFASATEAAFSAVSLPDRLEIVPTAPLSNAVGQELAVPPLATSPAVRFQRPSSPSPIGSVALASALLCIGCQDSPAGRAFLDSLNHLSPTAAALIAAMITGLIAGFIGPWMRAYSDVRFRATPEGTRRAAEGALFQTLEMLEAAGKLPEEKIRRLFLWDLVEQEKEELEKGEPKPILGRNAEIDAIFDSFLEIEQTSLVITGPPNSGTSTLIRAVARETAKRVLGRPSLCPPAWAEGRIYALRVERLMALDPDRRALILMAILAISRRDPQHVKLVIDNRPFLAGTHVSSVMAPILDAIQRSRIGVILAMTDEHFADLTQNGGKDLKEHLRLLKLSRLSEAVIGQVALGAFRDQLEDLQERDRRFKKLQVTLSPPLSEEVPFLKALSGLSAEEPLAADLGGALVLAREFAIYLYRRVLKGRFPSDRQNLAVDGELIEQFRRERAEKKL